MRGYASSQASITSGRCLFLPCRRIRSRDGSTVFALSAHVLVRMQPDEVSQKVDVIVHL